MSDQLDREREFLRHQRFLLVVDRVAGLGRTTIVAGSFVACAYILLLSIRAIAGTDTSFRAVVGAAVSMSADRWIYLIVAGVMTGAWRRERKIRMKAFEENAAYVRSLEQKVDPEVESSDLKDSGEPPKGE